MSAYGRGPIRRLGPALLLACVLAAGCRSTAQRCESCEICSLPVPRELDKATMPEYVIEPPDILLINSVRVVPRPPYRVEPLDVLYVQFPARPEVLTEEEVQGLVESSRALAGNVTVDPEGAIDLGPVLGKVRVAGLTLERVRQEVEERWLRSIPNPELVQKLRGPDPQKPSGQVVAEVVQFAAEQVIRGEHLVRPDGTVDLGTYGAVRVVGMTLPQAKWAIETHLGRFLQDPEITIDVAAYNSKVYYVILDGGGYGEQVVRLPITGNETVLDAISQLNGLAPVSSKHHIWVARPSPACSEDQILPVDWVGITTKGRTASNYQLLPGDRLYVQAYPLVTTDSFLARVAAPLERIFGVTILGDSVIRRYIGGLSNQGVGFLGFGF